MLPRIGSARRSGFSIAVDTILLMSFMVDAFSRPIVVTQGHVHGLARDAQRPLTRPIVPQLSPWPVGRASAHVDVPATQAPLVPALFWRILWMPYEGFEGL